MLSEPGTSPAPMPTPCPACGAPLVWAHADGRTVALDVRPLATYQLVIHEGVPRAIRSPAYVDHAAVCTGKAEKGLQKQEAKAYTLV